VRVAISLYFVMQLFSPAAARSQSASNQPQLPKPGGPFAVGRITFHSTDPSRPEPLAAKDGARRELMVYVLYPAVAGANAISTAPYFPDFDAARAAMSDDDFKDLFRPADERIRRDGLPLTHSIEAAKMPAGKARYPVLIFSHGWGLQSPVYSAALEDLASHGYVVVAVDHPYDTTVTVFPDGRIAKFAQNNFDAATRKPHGYIDYAYERIEVMAADIRFVIDELAKYDRSPPLGAPFAGRLDLGRVGAFGHSIGGMTSARACQIDSRIRACIDEDSIDDVGSPFAVIAPGSIPSQPFLLFAASSADIFSKEAVHPSDESLARQKLSRAEYDERIGKQQKKQDQLLGEVRGGAYRVMLFDLPGITHRSFSDLPLLAANGQSESQKALRNFRIIQDYVQGFFDKYLMGSKNTILDHKTGAPESVHVDRFGPAAK
jgi:pimeloyl-ACP methyl ester carboxylesterase